MRKPTSSITIPPNLDDPIVLRRILEHVLTRLDILEGLRNAEVSIPALDTRVTKLENP